jgi:hypothetical protein
MRRRFGVMQKQWLFDFTVSIYRGRLICSLNHKSSSLAQKSFLRLVGLALSLGESKKTNQVLGSLNGTKTDLNQEKIQCRSKLLKIMVKPIKPSVAAKKAQKAKESNIPPEVIKIFNKLIVKNLNGNRAIIEQEEAILTISSEMNVPRQTIFDLNYLNVESIFRKEGWRVEYDKPGFNEFYEPTFTFSR